MDKPEAARSFQFEVLKFDEPTFGSRYIFDMYTLQTAVNMYMQHINVDGSVAAHNRPQYLGQLGTRDGMALRVDLMSHRVKKLIVEPRHRKLFVQIVTLNTPSGMILQEFIETSFHSVRPGLVGIGALTPEIYGAETAHRVQQDYRLLGVDMLVNFDPIYRGPKPWSTIDASQ